MISMRLLKMPSLGAQYGKMRARLDSLTSSGGGTGSNKRLRLIAFTTCFSGRRRVRSTERSIT